jgi:hypothetical protein
MSEPKIVAECWTCCAEHGGRKYSCVSTCKSGFPLREPTAGVSICGVAGSYDGAARIQRHRAAGHDVRPVEAKP